MLESSVEDCPSYSRNVISGFFLLFTVFPFVFYGISLALSYLERYLFYTLLFIGMVFNQACGVAFTYAVDFKSLPVAQCAIDTSTHIDDNCATAVFVSLYFIIARYRRPTPTDQRASWEEFKYYLRFIVVTTLVIASNLYLQIWTGTDMVLSAMFAALLAPFFCFVLIDIIQHQLQHHWIKWYCEKVGLCTDRIGRDWPPPALVFGDRPLVDQGPKASLRSLTSDK